MTVYYLDTSALIKLYVPENGSLWVDQVVNAEASNGARLHVVAIAKIGIAEVAAALARHERIGSITPEKQHRLYRAFLNDSKSIFQTLVVSDISIYLGADLTQRLVLRGYGAIHLASALLLNCRLIDSGSPPLVFASADNQLCNAATSEGLMVENPANYP
ncbi:MAG: type II toxin-antitoxin system VapC family toxin [Anaerolineales bacterium]|nr:type II toxin-antitoxin system VapC family toxin [Anaerolineales bacterium]